MKKTSFCPYCNKTVGYKTKLIDEIDPIKGKMVSYKAVYAFCEECQESIDAKECEQSKINAWEAYKRQEGLLSGEEIRKSRKGYGLSAVGFSRILGLADKTITRYENGEIQNESIDCLLRLAANEEAFYHLFLLKMNVLTSIEKRKAIKAFQAKGFLIESNNNI